MPQNDMTFCVDPGCNHIREIHDENGCDVCYCKISGDDGDHFKTQEQLLFAKEKGLLELCSKCKAKNFEIFFLDTSLVGCKLVVRCGKCHEDIGWLPVPLEKLIAADWYAAIGGITTD